MVQSFCIYGSSFLNSNHACHGLLPTVDCRLFTYIRVLEAQEV